MSKNSVLPSSEWTLAFVFLQLNHDGGNSFFQGPYANSIGSNFPLWMNNSLESKWVMITCIWISSHKIDPGINNQWSYEAKSTIYVYKHIIYFLWAEVNKLIGKSRKYSNADQQSRIKPKRN